MRRFNLPIYFQLRVQEIAKQLEAALARSDAAADTAEDGDGDGGGGGGGGEGGEGGGGEGGGGGGGGGGGVPKPRQVRTRAGVAAAAALRRCFAADVRLPRRGLRDASTTRAPPPTRPRLVLFRCC